MDHKPSQMLISDVYDDFPVFYSDVFFFPSIDRPSPKEVIGEAEEETEGKGVPVFFFLLLVVDCIVDC